MTKIWKMAEAFAVCSLFMAVGPALMVLNKEILDTVGFRYPILVSWLGLAPATAMAYILRLTGNLELKLEKIVDRNFWITRCLPIGLCHAASLCFGNMQYLYSGMALIQFLKSFTPIVTALVSYCLLGRAETRLQSGALVLLCLGASLSATGNMDLTASGLLLAMGSSLTESARLVLTEFLLSGYSMGVMESTYHMAPAGAICLLAVGLLLEGPQLFASGDVRKLNEFPLTFALAAGLGLVISLLTTMVIKATSATILKVLGQVRNAIPVLCGALLYGEVVAPISLLGYVLSAAAFGWYTYLKALDPPDPAAGDVRDSDGAAAAEEGREGLLSAAAAEEGGAGAGGSPAKAGGDARVEEGVELGRLNPSRLG